jgi:hypothetical protein
MNIENIKNKMEDIIQNNIELESEPYGDYCTECMQSKEYVDSRSVTLAVNNIIKMLIEEKVINVTL